MRLMIALVLIGALGGGVSAASLAVQDDFPVNRKRDVPLSYGATFQVGAKTPLAITILAGDESSHTIQIETVSQRGSNPNKEYGSEYSIENSVLRFRGAVNLLYHVHPRIIRYTDEQIASRLKAWEKVAVASEREVHIEIRPVSDGLAVWLDGKYAGSIACSGGLKRVSFAGGDDALVKDREFFSTLENDRFLPLEYGRVANSDAMQNATGSLRPGGQLVAGIPMIVSDGAHSGDIAEAKQMRGSWALECDDYYSRTSFDGMPESQIVSVPQRFYHRAWVLFAVDPDPKKDPMLTVRLTRFAGKSRVGRGEAIADMDLNLPRNGQRPDDGIRQVGTVMLNEKDGSPEVPLYLAAVDIPLGEILDLLSQEGQDSATELKIGPYLDFEILGRCGAVGPQWDEQHKPTGAPSAANIFGVTLEKAPAELRLTPREVGNIFHNDETPEMDVSVMAYRTGTYQLQWTVTDIDGTQVQRGDYPFSLKAGETAKHTISLQQNEVGHYDIEMTLKDEQQHPFFSHAAAFALLPHDTREAGLDSPYSVWWFGGSHLTTRDIAQAGPLHLKAGLRRTVSRNYSEAEMAAYKMTVTSLGWAFRTADLDDFEAATKRVYTQTTDLLARYPSCNNALIFHESHANILPEELIGNEPNFTTEQREDAERKVKLANRVGAFYREQFPDVKLVVGNSGGSAKLMADLLRFGFDPQYADFVGIESPGQSFMPEAISEHNLQSAWLAREVVRQRGQEIPITGCPEFTYRADRLIGARRQAEHYVRDILISHAYGFKHIGPGTLEDAGGSYYNSLWGGAGIVRRAPLLYPKPSYVAIATATRVLDKATRTRIIPTGSLSVYAVEFKRDRQQPDLVYGTWAPRGSAGLEFAFDEATEAEVVDLYGRSRRVATGADHTLTIETGPAATYVIVGKPVQSISIASRDFSAEDPPATFKPAETMADVNAWELISDDRLVNNFRKPGNFEMRGVNDSERGPCIELELKPNTSLSPLVSEYTVMRLREPAPLIGEPHSIGVWVKGNSNWGKVFFEVSDADDQRWHCDGGYNDWPADLAVNFDGWRFLQFFIDEDRSAMYSSPGRQWKSSGHGTQPKYPLRVTALYVTMHRQALDPVEMRDVVPVLRFQNIGAYE
ncbi:hypothetical protein Pla52o_55590 [Novipirellula galeiformis]|uniref:Uncharacterized protein n=1 Tax=Novipirellula galeiformis TaxID=2528004 RepID=A0A5C6BT83_9BACT|nr:hypothetical protein [Novipirellula galeiformis]TWU15022.1 hypothetical protein Pla52o_55590 [Novipirellula galeiformis]